MSAPLPSVRLTFLGAAGTVTGSKYLVESDNTRVLIDCGIFQGRKELRLRNWEKPAFDIQSLDAIVLTHAHIDHSGYLPLVTKLGYRGPIYCTAATKDLLGLLLPDSAHLQEEEARYNNKHGTSKHHPAKPLYSVADADRALSQLKVIPRDTSSSVAKGFHVTPICAGHILGACSLSLDVHGKRITFSGDIGRYDTPLLPDPQPVALGDLLLCESTYGDRDHAPGDPESKFAQIIKDAAQRGGPLIIPAFALGRTQNLLYAIAKLEREGQIPVLPVYVDSPMAVDATQIYRRYHQDYDDEAKQMMARGETPMLTEQTIFCRSVEDSKALNSLTMPRIIISAGGMVNGGRVMHHMMHWLPKEETTVLFVGYQAEETRGRQLQSGAKEIKMFGSYVPVRAKMTELSGLSAHGDRNELTRWLHSCTGSPTQVKIVHGEPGPASAFSEKLRNEFKWRVDPAKHLEQVEI